MTESISCELLQQAMTELSQTLTEYKVCYDDSDENIPKGFAEKDGKERVIEQINTVPVVAQLARTWPDLPPYPPR